MVQGFLLTLAHATPQLHPEIDWRPAALVLILVGWAVLTDVTQGVVTNMNVLVLLGLGVYVQIGRIQAGVPYLQVLVLAGVAVFIGFLLYLLQFWAAGDGKLFAAICLALPFGGLPQSNAIVPIEAMTWILGLAAVYALAAGARIALRRLPAALHGGIGSIKAEGRRLQGSLSLKKVVQTLLTLLVFVGVSRMAQSVLPIRLGPVQPLLFGALFSLAIGRLSPRFQQIVILPLAAVGGYYLASTPWLELLAMAIGYPLVFALRYFVRLTDRVFTQAMPIVELRRGVYLADYLVLRNDGTIDVMSKQDWAANRGRGIMRILGPDNGALGPRETEAARMLVLDGKLPVDRTIRISWSLPFAPFITLGTMLAVVFLLV